MKRLFACIVVMVAGSLAVCACGDDPSLNPDKVHSSSPAKTEGLGADAGKTSSADAGQEPLKKVDNVAACKRWLESYECGTFDLSAVLACDTFGAYPCDISAYFDCLTQNTGCQNGVPDTTGWTKCTSKTSCS